MLWAVSLRCSNTVGSGACYRISKGHPEVQRNPLEMEQHSHQLPTSAPAKCPVQTIAQESTINPVQQALNNEIPYY